MKSKFIDKLGQLNQHKQAIDLSCQNSRGTLFKIKNTYYEKIITMCGFVSWLCWF